MRLLLLRSAATAALSAPLRPAAMDSARALAAIVFTYYLMTNNYFLGEQAHLFTQ